MKKVFELADRYGNSLNFFASLSGAKAAAIEEDGWVDTAYWSDDEEISYCYEDGNDENSPEIFKVYTHEVFP